MIKNNDNKVGEEMGGKDEGVANTYIGYLGLFYMKLANFSSFDNFLFRTLKITSIFDKLDDQNISDHPL